MQYPELTTLNSSRRVIGTFAGYNHNLSIGENEFYDMENLTSTFFPILSPRGKRGRYTSPEKPLGLISKDALCYVDGKYFVINEHRIDMGLSDEEKQLVSMGAYVIILPDKKYINTAELDDRGNIEARFDTISSVKFELCTVDGAAYDIAYRQAVEPESPQNMELWIDTSTTPHTLKQYSSTGSMWLSIATTYIKITATGIGGSFSQYDGVTISGLKDAALTDSESGEPVAAGDINAIDGSYIIWAKGNDYIVITGILDTTATITNKVTVERKMPNLDFVVESENRLWGCRYGTAVNGEVVNEIYACKLGDFKNWNCFMGIATDSYAVAVGTDGRFTGAITHRGYPLFFKENCLHKIYGNMPSNYQVNTTACRGVQRGSEKSLAIVNEILYYKSQKSICAYDGSLPYQISDALGQIVYTDAVAGGYGDKYYVSMQNDGEWSLFVYDTVKKMWHKEDALHATAFCACRDDLYYIDHDNNQIWAMNGGTEEGLVHWMAETGVIGVDMPDKKYLSRLVVRLSMEVGSRVYFAAQYDSCGPWEPLGAVTGKTLRSFNLPLRPRRCDHLRLRITGDGVSHIYSIAKTIEQGSDVE